MLKEKDSARNAFPTDQWSQLTCCGKLSINFFLKLLVLTVTQQLNWKFDKRIKEKHFNQFKPRILTLVYL
jgi:hypothetical protein